MDNIEQSQPEKLKRAVIKEELVALTGDFKLAIVLNQMIYWMERRKDFDKFLMEERERQTQFVTEGEAAVQPEVKPSNGWIYKKAEELSEETMMGVTPKGMRAYLKTLVERGWLDQRRNPNVAMDRTLQYRVNLLKVQLDLFKLGYALEGYPLPKVILENTNLLLVNTKEQNVTSTKSSELTKEQNVNSETAKLPKVNSKEQKVNRKGDLVNRKGEKVKAIPEITTETNSETTNHKPQPPETENDVVVENYHHYQDMLFNMFDVHIKEKDLKRLLDMCADHNKDLYQCAKNVLLYFATKQEVIEDLMSALVYEIRTGWELPTKAEPIKAQSKKIPKSVAKQQPQKPQLTEEEYAKKRAIVEAKIRKHELLTAEKTRI